ncbi:MAG: ribose-phosphate diphosphokinase, partial [Candidatus Bipolaricaulia bacterium]
QEEGAGEVYAAFTHGLFAGDALKRLRASPLQRVIVTNSVPPPDDGDGIIERISVGGLFAEVIGRIHENRSVSEVFPHL